MSGARWLYPLLSVSLWQAGCREVVVVLNDGEGAAGNSAGAAAGTASSAGAGAGHGGGHPTRLGDGIIQIRVAPFAEVERVGRDAGDAILDYQSGAYRVVDGAGCWVHARTPDPAWAARMESRRAVS